MPWSPKQHRYFEAIAHGMKTKDGESGPSKEEAEKLAGEGIKKKPSRMDKLYGKKDK